MNKLITIIDRTLEKNPNSEECQKDILGENKKEKVLCDHCGRTSGNGIRCLGICVADSDY